MPSLLRRRADLRALSRPTALVLAASAAALLAGCGNTRLGAPPLSNASPPGGFRSVTYAGAGASLRAPRFWAAAAQQAPLVVTISSGPAVIALWRYPGRPQASTPAGSAALGQALAALIGAARAHDPGLRVVRTGLATVDGAGAVELDVVERINGRLRRVRSEHIYLPGGELVLEEYAPLALFPSVDHSVFSPVRRSLHLLPATAA